MQACARIGATHSVGVRRLLRQVAAANGSSTPARSAVITADEQVRGGKPLPLKAIVDEALGMGGCEAVTQRRRLSAHRQRKCGWHGRTRRLDARADAGAGRDLRAGVGRAPSIRCSSSTRRDRPASRRASSTRTGGYLLWAALTMKWVFDIKPSDVFWCTADIGWVTGHTYITYGPLACGATEVVFEGMPTYPDAGRFWKMIADAQGHDLLHRADGDPLADQGVRCRCRRCAPNHYDLSEPAPARLGRRADQSRSVDVVPQAHRRRDAARSSTRGGRPKPAAT